MQKLHKNNYKRCGFGKANKTAICDLQVDKFRDTFSSGQKEREVLTLLTALKDMVLLPRILIIK